MFFGIEGSPSRINREISSWSGVSIDGLQAGLLLVKTRGEGCGASQSSWCRLRIVHLLTTCRCIVRDSQVALAWRTRAPIVLLCTRSRTRVQDPLKRGAQWMRANCIRALALHSYEFSFKKEPPYRDGDGKPESTLCMLKNQKLFCLYVRMGRHRKMLPSRPFIQSGFIRQVARAKNLTK